MSMPKVEKKCGCGKTFSVAVNTAKAVTRCQECQKKYHYARCSEQHKENARERWRQRRNKPESFNEKDSPYQMICDPASAWGNCTCLSRNAIDDLVKMGHIEPGVRFRHKRSKIEYIVEETCGVLHWHKVKVQK